MLAVFQRHKETISRCLFSDISKFSLFPLCSRNYCALWYWAERPRGLLVEKMSKENLAVGCIRCCSRERLAVALMTAVLFCSSMMEILTVLLRARINWPIYPCNEAFAIPCQAQTIETWDQINSGAIKSEHMNSVFRSVLGVIFNFKLKCVIFSGHYSIPCGSMG